jgi:hypothetical protein
MTDIAMLRKPRDSVALIAFRPTRLFYDMPYGSNDYTWFFQLHVVTTGISCVRPGKTPNIQDALL